MTGTVAHLTLDAEGRLVEAEPALAALNARAGGGPGLPLAVPPLAGIARLAGRLGIAVARPVVVADEESDVELWVRVEPAPDGGATLSAGGWTERPAWAPPGGEPSHGFDAADADWRWQTDASLRLIRLTVAEGRRRDVEAAASIGRPVELLFDFGEAALPDRLLRRQPFADLPATLRGRGEPIVVSAAVLQDEAGRFAGYDGVARLSRPATTVPPSRSPAFAMGLDEVLRPALERIVADADAISAAAEGPIGADYADYAADIGHAGRHLVALFDDLIELDAVERPDFAPAAEPIDLADVARRAAAFLSASAGDDGVAIERPLPGVALWARGDARRALQVLVNLIGNAVRYAPAGSIVLVGLTRTGGRASVTISDEGKGIAAADQARVFGKFERVDPSEPGGSGLGLYIARRLSRAMRGDVTLVSTAGAGASFTLSLPATEPPPPEPLPA